MKIKLLKNHLDNKKDDVIDVSDKRGKYFIRTGVGKEKTIKQLKEPVSKKLPKTRKDGVSSVSTPKAHDDYIKSQNSK